MGIWKKSFDVSLPATNSASAPLQFWLITSFLRFPPLGELGAIAEAPGKFAAFPRDLIPESAHMLAMYGISSVEASKQTDKQARGYLFEDLRMRGDVAFPEISFSAALSQHPPFTGRIGDGSILGVGHSARTSFLCATFAASRWIFSTFPGNGQSNPKRAGGSGE